MDEFGRQLDVVAKDLLVLSDAVDVSYPTNQVAVDDWSQFTVTELTEKPKNNQRLSINICQGRVCLMFIKVAKNVGRPVS